METNPFESPKAVETRLPQRGGAANPVGRYVSGSLRANVVTVLLALNGLLNVAGIGAFISQALMLGRALNGGIVAKEEGAANDLWVNGIAIAETGLLLISGIAFLVWLHRIYRNLPTLGVRHLEFSPGWAVGCWFVPLLNLFRPYQVVKEAWLASDPKQVGHPRWRSAPVTPLLGAWWASWIITRVGGRLIGVMFEPTPGGVVGLSQMRTGSLIVVGVEALSIASAVLAILVVRDITNRQERAHDVVITGGVPGDNPALWTCPLPTEQAVY